ncbi:TetR/AcrR family transcriptional regulator [Nocardia abscessus]|uniref:TetR/AcrR family transcriptional regulator n=1 Tax=Nocardia abscessus TaxID=120957 RepID=UPI0024538AED|nr:helix-turn-helix domain-containing protein [Nocardia abscessus]
MTARTRAHQRAEEVLTAAMSAFAACGYTATTADIARRAGITQPYVLRLFGTKQSLFLAALDRAGSRLTTALLAIGSGEPDAAGGEPFLAERESLLVLLHACAAATADADIGVSTRAHFGLLYQSLQETGHTPAAARHRLATALLVAAEAAIEPRLVGPRIEGVSD